MKLNYSEKQLRLIAYLENEKLSLSHQLDHLEKVANYAAELAYIYKANTEVVISAALLHDLGRMNLALSGRQSAEEGARLAVKPLDEVGYSAKEAQQIMSVISEHDQPKNSPSSIEALILKEADFLAGLGAEGIFRSIQYTTELGKGRLEALERIQVKARVKLETLTLPAAKRLGWKLYRFMRLFTIELSKLETVRDYAYSGKLVVFEGISGSGKDTQANALKTELELKGRKVILVNHPTDFLKQKIWLNWRTLVDDRQSELYLMLADRIRMVRSVILPALLRGEVVISTRSSISARVYQRETGITSEIYPYLFSFEPLADAYIFLDISPEAAYLRAQNREQHKPNEKSFFFTNQTDQLAEYQKVLKEYPNVFVVKAEGTEEEVCSRVYKQVARIWD